LPLPFKCFIIFCSMGKHGFNPNVIRLNWYKIEKYLQDVARNDQKHLTFSNHHHSCVIFIFTSIGLIGMIFYFRVF
jgi:hypothetical protein